MLLSISTSHHSHSPCSVHLSHVPHVPLWTHWQTAIFWTRTTWAQQGNIRATATKSLNRCDPLLNPTMFQNSSNVRISGGTFINNSTFVNEQNGMTGALYEFVVNRYFLTSIYAKRSPDIASMGFRWSRPWFCASCTRMSPRYSQNYHWWNHELDRRPLSHV